MSQHEQSLFPASIEDYVPAEAPVRVYDAFVEALEFGECTKSRLNGRKIVRYVNEEFRERLQLQYEQPDSQAIYKLRKQKVELPFGHMKGNLNGGHFLLRGLEGVRAEASLLVSCFNLARMITLIGVPALIAELAN